MTQKNAEAAYRAIILCAADDVQTLRRSDVDRVIVKAHERGEVHGFAKWLAWQRPEYGLRISEAYAEVTGIVAIKVSGPHETGRPRRGLIHTEIVPTSLKGSAAP